LTISPGMFGGYQAIMIDPKTGALFGGSDPRKDGCAIGW
jgi:gamma-glutamyltranspeptidase / glutathione hydrolase